MCIHLGGRLNIYPAGKINRVDAVQSSCKGMAGVIALGLKGHWDAVELNEQGGRKGAVANPEKEKRTWKVAVGGGSPVSGRGLTSGDGWEESLPHG